jgi:hypothetical protein
MARQQLIDGRKAETREMAERALALPDPVEQAPPKLEDLLHPEARHWCTQLERFLHSTLAPWRSELPIVAPAIEQLRPLLWACQGGHNQSHDPSAAWRLIFGTSDGAAQARIRSLWQAVRELRYPAPAQHEQLVNALAGKIIDVFTAAAEQQRARLEKAEAERGPVVKAQSAAALLEALPVFRAAFEAYTKVAGNFGWAELRDDLGRVERAARRELS